MNLAVLKSTYKKLPTSVTQPLTWVPFSYFGGQSYRSQLQELESNKHLSFGEMSTIRDKKLIQYVNEAIEFTPYYRDVAKKLKIHKISHTEQIFDFPILSKEILSEDLDRFADQRVANARYLVTTGGTTGGQTRLYMSNDCYGREWSFVNDLLKRNGVDPDSKRLCLRGVEGIPPDQLTSYNPLYKEMLISPFRLSPDRVLANLQKIQRFNPRWIHGYPSSVAAFSRIIMQLGLNLPSVTHVLLVSEKLYPDQEAQIRQAFGNNIISFYGLTERVIFAEEKNKAFYPHPLYGATELVDDELVATGFLNQATRLIRYRTGDNAEAVFEGGFVSRIDAITGRRGREFLLGKSGTQVTMTALNIHNDLLDNVVRYQFYQTQKGQCILKLQTGPGFELRDFSTIVRMFQLKVGNELDITGQIVDEIPLSPRGKHRYIISEMEIDYPAGS